MDNTTNVTHTPLEIIAIKSIIFTIAAIAAVIGNTLVVIVIFQYNSTQTVTNYLVMNLSIFGTMNGLVRLPLYIVNIIADRQYYDQVGCAFHAYLGGIIFIGTIHNLMWIAVVRYLVVVKSKKLKPRHAYYFIGIIWATCTLTPAVSFLGWGKFVYVEIEKGCIPSWDKTGIIGIARGIYSAIFHYATPLLTIIYCYSFIFIFLEKKQQ
ncbi:uncharacterized protein TRIADDRAFT_62841, partial [Trichoplax adhaerens]